MTGVSIIEAGYSYCIITIACHLIICINNEFSGNIFRTNYRICVFPDFSCTMYNVHRYRLRVHKCDRAVLG